MSIPFSQRSPEDSPEDTRHPEALPMHGLHERLQLSRGLNVAHAVPQEAPPIVVLAVGRQAPGHRLRQEKRLLAQHILAAGAVVAVAVVEPHSEPEERPENVAGYGQHLHHADSQLAAEARLHVLHPGLVQLHAAATDARAHDAPGDSQRRGGPGAAAVAEQSVKRAASGVLLARQATRSPGRLEGPAPRSAEIPA